MVVEKGSTNTNEAFSRVASKCCKNHLNHDNNSRRTTTTTTTTTTPPTAAAGNTRSGISAGSRSSGTGSFADGNTSIRSKLLLAITISISITVTLHFWHSANTATSLNHHLKDGDNSIFFQPTTLLNSNNNNNNNNGPSSAMTILPRQQERTLCNHGRGGGGGGDRDNHLPFDAKELQQILNANNQFHLFGGGLRSVIDFRTSAVDDTLRALELEFVPDTDTNNNDNDNDNTHPTSTTNVLQYLKDYFTANFDPRGGYGKPLPGKFIRKGDHSKKRVRKKLFLTGDRWVEPMEQQTGRAKWDASLGPIGPNCTNLATLGNMKRGDGYKFFCSSTSTETFKTNNNIKKENKNETCHIISIGGNDNWEFEKAVSQDLGCMTHTFDCTLPNNRPRRKPANKNIRFYPYCIDKTSYTDPHGRSFLTYQEMLQIADIPSKPIYLKIDVEGFEYSIFSQMIQQDYQNRMEMMTSNMTQEKNNLDSSVQTTASAATTKQSEQQQQPQQRKQHSEYQSLLPEQIQVELHWVTRMAGVDWMSRTLSSGELALFSSMMYNAGGYVPIHLDFNPHCAPCMEVLYYKVLC